MTGKQDEKALWDAQWSKLQPIRIPAGWHVVHNELFDETEPEPHDPGYDSLKIFAAKFRKDVLVELGIDHNDEGQAKFWVAITYFKTRRGIVSADFIHLRKAEAIARLEAVFRDLCYNKRYWLYEERRN